MFSIIIPLYNKELSIKNTIQSVLSQTCQDFEIVVINDGSTDNSVKIVESVKDNRIRLIQQENQGVSAARNRGIKEASYDWIAFLDADDLWEVNHLEEINKMMALFPDEKIYVTSFEFSDNRKVFKHIRNKSIFIIENYFREAIKENLMWTSIVVVNKNCFDKVGGFNPILKNGEDLELWSRLAKDFRIVKSTAITAIYRTEAENRTSLSKEVKSTHAYNFDLSLNLEEDEESYYRFIILQRLYSYNRNMDINSFTKLKAKHSEITWSEYFLFVLGFLAKKIGNNLIAN